MLSRRHALFGCAALLANLGCRIEVGPPTSTQPPSTSTSSTSTQVRGKVVLYTSLYPEVVDAVVALSKQALPDVEVVVFQGGSEKVAARLDADLAAGTGQGADVLLVSDPFLSRRLKSEGQLLAHVSPHATPIDRRLVDVDNAFVAARASTMVIAHHRDRTPATDVPQTFHALLTDDDAPAKDVALGDPLSSGTAFMTVVVVGGGDPGFVGRLRARGAAIAGGNSVVLQKVLSGERRFGVVLLENVLAARDRGEPVGFVIPTDGAVVIPGDIAILRSTQNAAAAHAFVDVVLSPDGQALMRGATGHMHAADPRVPPPADDVPALATLLDARPVSPALLTKIAAEKASALRGLERALLGTGAP